ncbi:hypothetical protein BB559_005965 [Furculomyces boomerangus]|uniref:RING-type domain-containing protein n=2 Tax=Harpellales TaxID=61421 RepID=A0A2T9Y5Q1_9FUNG|nr:hypothetical protein BB559_005965 [Furculomyces boomerangus]PWA02231.1 hypothetical protein BB558_001626 [Smittium angustum]
MGFQERQVTNTVADTSGSSGDNRVFILLAILSMLLIGTAILVMMKYSTSEGNRRFMEFEVQDIRRSGNEKLTIEQLNRIPIYVINNIRRDRNNNSEPVLRSYEGGNVSESDLESVANSEISSTNSQTNLLSPKSRKNKTESEKWFLGLNNKFESFDIELDEKKDEKNQKADFDGFDNNFIIPVIDITSPSLFRKTRSMKEVPLKHRLGSTESIEIQKEKENTGFIKDHIINVSPRIFNKIGKMRKSYPKSLSLISQKTGSEEPEDLICPICLDEMSTGEKVRLLPCGHKYHVRCIDNWLLTRSVLCPYCKLNIKTALGETKGPSQQGDIQSVSPRVSVGSSDNEEAQSILNNTWIHKISRFIKNCSVVVKTFIKNLFTCNRNLPTGNNQNTD